MGRRYWPTVSTWTRCSRSWPNVSTISSKLSPRPTIRPDFVITSGPPISLAFRRTRAERRNSDPRGRSGRGGDDLAVVVEDVRLLGDHLGERHLLAAEVGSEDLDLAAGGLHPDRTDHADEGACPVIGQVVAVDGRDHGVLEAHLGNRAGDARRLEGVVPRRLAVLTLQKPQRRVQVSPRIMKVAVPRSQHSPTLGQFASSQTVCRRSPWICALSSRYFGPPGAGTFSHGGLRSRKGRPATFSIAIPPGRARERVLCSRSGASTGGGVLTPSTLARRSTDAYPASSTIVIRYSACTRREPSVASLEVS